jgi:hypothetical protein
MKRKITDAILIVSVAVAVPLFDVFAAFKLGMYLPFPVLFFLSAVCVGYTRGKGTKGKVIMTMVIMLLQFIIFFLDFSIEYGRAMYEIDAKYSPPSLPVAPKK